MDGFHACKREKKPAPNLMSVPSYCKQYDKDIEHKDTSKTMLDVSDPGKLLLLTESLINTNTLDLEKKINRYIQLETRAECVFIITIFFVSNEAIVQVIGQKVLPLQYRSRLSRFMKNLIVTSEGVPHGISEFDENFRTILNDALDPKDTDINFVTVPVTSKFKRGDSFTVPILVSVINSKKSEEFITKMIKETFRFCLPILTNTAKLEEEAKVKTQCQSLLHVARKLFSHVQNLNELLREIMVEARKLTNAERCSLFLLDPDHLHLVAKVFDGVVQDVRTEVRIAKDQGIAGHVALTGKLLNIRDAYNHPLFYKGVDETTGFRTKNILCFPIRDEQGIIGVAQLCNKTTGDFDFFDEEVALAFSIYCGISIQHGLIYKKMLQATHHSKVSNELMLYHMNVGKEDVLKILLCTNRHAYLSYYSFNFVPRRIRFSETPCQILRIFEELHFLTLFNIKRDVFTRFILLVKKGYRDTPYHNWMHAFSVAHFAASTIKNFKLIEDQYLTPLEAMAYIVSCICHDIDHRGTTNSFQCDTGSVFANLYSSEGSVMEHHHLSQALCILNTEDCNFLESLSQPDYIYFLALMKDYILATDLSNHFKISNRRNEILEKGYDKHNADNKYILQCLLINCCDLSDQTKEWNVIKNVAEFIYEEFFTEGDLQKNMGKQPSNMMDREQASIPDLQIGFLSEVCLPIFSILVFFFPSAVILTKNIERNIEYWKVSKNIFAKLMGKGMKSLEILNSDELCNEMNAYIAKQVVDVEAEVFDYDSDSEDR